MIPITANGLGDHVGTNDPFYNPNTDPSLNNQNSGADETGMGIMIDIRYLILGYLISDMIIAV